MSETYKGFKVLEVEDQIIDSLYKEDSVGIWDKRIAFYPNLYLELKSTTNPKKTILAKVTTDGLSIKRIIQHNVLGITSRNREQAFALDALMDDSIPVVVLTGLAGSGKTLMAIATVIQKIQTKKYNKAVITRPMSQVGKYQLGALPGDVKDKFQPYLINYTSNLEVFAGGKANVDYLIDQYKLEMIPIQLFRGASFNGTMVIADEMQVIDHQEMLTIGTRTGEGSKLVIMGDLNQRDEKIAKDKTGLHKLMNDHRVKESPLVAVIELQKCERSETARMFAEIFEE